MEEISEISEMKLTRAPLHTLKIESVDGVEVILKIKNPTVKESRAIQKEMARLNFLLKQSEENARSISDVDEIANSTEHSISLLKLLCEDFNEDDLDDIEAQDIDVIASKIIDLKTKSLNEKKKAQSLGHIST